MNITSLHQPHDKLFKRAFHDKEVLHDFLVSRMPRELIALVDMKSIAIEPTTFVEEDLRETRSDLVCSVRINDRKGYLYFLVDAKSTQESNLHLKLLKYNVQLMERHMHEHKTNVFPAIVNVILYSGKEPYQGPKTLFEAFASPKQFNTMFKTPFVIDLRADSEERIMQDGKAALLEMVLRQGKLRDFNQWLDSHDTIGAMIHSSSYGESVIIYMVDREKKDKKAILEKLRKLVPEKSKEVMHIFQQYREEGIAQGMKQGKKEGIEEVMNYLISKGIVSNNVVDSMANELLPNRA